MLQAGHTVYVGRGARTNGEGIRQLRSLLAPLGRTVIAVPLGEVLHLKSAVTALPDGTFLLLPELVQARLFPPAVRLVAEEGGSHVVPLGGDRVLIAASASRTAELLDDLGFTPIVVDISEFEKLEGCVTCLSVLLPRTVEPVTSSVSEIRRERRPRTGRQTPAAVPGRTRRRPGHAGERGLAARTLRAARRRKMG